MPRVSGKTALGLAAFAAGLVFLAVLPGMLSVYWLTISTSAAIAVLTAISLGALTGRAGIMSLCQLSLAGISAWATAYLYTKGFNPPTPIMVLVSGLAAVPIGVALAIPALRVRGINLAIVTLGFATFATAWLVRTPFPGLDEGKIIARTSGFVEDRQMFWLACGFAIAGLIVMALIDRSRLGSSWLGLRHSERALASLGVSVAWAKISAFGISAYFAGVGGSLLVMLITVADSSSFAPIQSLVVFAVAIMVGARYWEGAIMAGLFGAFIPSLLDEFGVANEYGNISFGIGMITSLMGGGGAAEQIRDSLRRRGNAKRAAAAEAAAAAAPPVPEQVDADAILKGVKRVVPAGTKPVLRLKDVTVKYGAVTALNEVNLEVLEGSVHALIGPNGSGKSTFVDTVTGFIHGYGGEIYLGDRRIDDLGATARARAGVRRTFQQGLAIPTLTIQRYLELSAHRSMGKAEAQELMDFLDGPSATEMIVDIEVGSRRLVELAAGLAARPKLLLLDEPGAGLAHAESALLGARLLEVPERFGTTVVLIDHDMELVQASCSAITVLDFGKVIADGPAEEVFQRAAVVDAYLGADDASIELSNA